MLLTLTTTYQPATDLGYLLRKNPARTHVFNQSFGKATVFFPEATDSRCTAALLMEVDPVGLVRNRRGPDGENHALAQYVNDRPYVASSFLSVAIADVYGSALSGGCKDRPELAVTPIPLEATLAVVPCSGGEEFLKRLFEPLGYKVTAKPHLLDPQYPDWGASKYFTVHLSATIVLSRMLAHLYVLIPVLDNDKHYWVGDDEVEKLLRHGEGWLSEHPDKELIAQRYLKHRRTLVDEAMARLIDDDAASDDGAGESESAQPEAVVEKELSLNQQRLGTVLAVLKQSGAARVLDLGCGEGRLLALLSKERQFTEIRGMDVSHRVLEITSDRLHLDRLPEKQKARLQLFQGSLMYRDERLAGYDAAAVIEVIEHLDAPRLAAFERVLFEFARPGFVVLTTPNVEYNVKWESLDPGKPRHKDHRFEWSRAEFQSWARGICERFKYTVRFLPIGPEDPLLGPPTQMAVFERASA
jgi:3' terminal RNA ribose 2'-O-methyltransferase Hen1